MADTRTYQVDYLISMKDGASAGFESIAKQANAMKQPLQELQQQITNLRTSLRSLRESYSESLKIQVSVDMASAKTQLEQLKKSVRNSANEIATMMRNALAGTSSHASTRKEYKKQIDALEKELNDRELVIFADEKTNKQNLLKTLRKEYQNAPKKAATKTNVLQQYSELAKRSNALSTAAIGIQNINSAIKKLDTGKPHQFKIDADISPAVRKLNTLLETIRTNVAALPITVTEAGKAAAAGTRGGAAVNPKTGKATKTGAKNVKAASKGSFTKITESIKSKRGAGAVIDIVPIAKENEYITQLNQSIEKLQEKAKGSPIVLRGSFNGGDAGFQLNQSIAKLNEIAKTKPIVIRSTFNGSDAAFQLRLSLSKLQELANSVPIVVSSASSAANKGNNASKSYATPAQMAAYERHRESMSQLRIDRSILAAKEKHKLATERHAALQAQYEELWGNGTTSNAKPNSGKSGRVAVKPSLYTRAKAFWYPFTGNTSFGARTPMAVDMAKGMGTMFAIGGAMSAIGSSLSQSVNYQNIMATTQAILKNGTNNYSDGGFKNMEHVVRQVGKETKFTAPQVASAAKFLAMAGYDIPSIKSAINPVANIALIGDTNLGETADKLTNVMTTFGIKPEDMNNIADIMTSTFTRSNTDMMMLAESAKYAGGIAHLYGGNFQNNFSDVMAMFGALGNAGIQASSAGTTLRMMYQNLMQPNKNQKKTLAHYGIKTRDSSGAPLEMVAILKQISEKVPKAQLADAVGNMFRITAQPGAAALVNAVGNGSLVNLMEANRNAAGTGVAQSIANEKKNTLSGLWAQVESTFTEGILQALEGRQGGWAGELMKLRDYLAKPETVQMLSSIVDMVEQLARVIQYFAKAWARIYNTFPKLINFWMYVQLAFTQLGYLATPIIQILSALDKFGVGKATAGAVAATGETAAEMALNAHNNELKQRYINRYGYKGVAKRTWTGGFSVGRAMGTLSFASMFSGLKNMALSLFGGLAKAIGLLVSPVGLAVTGFVALAGWLGYIYNRLNKYHDNLKIAEESSKWMETANYGVHKNYIQSGVEVGGFKPVEIGYAKDIEDNSTASYHISNSVADVLADKGNTYGLTGSQILSKYASGFDFLPKSYIEEYKRTHQDYDYTSSYTPGGQVTMSKTENEKAVEDARKLGMIALWGEEASKQKDIVQAMKDLQEAMKNKNNKKVQDILNAYKPTSQSYMYNLENAEKIQKITDPTKFREWQEVQYNILEKLVQEQQSPLLHYQTAMDLLDKYNGLSAKDRKDYDVSQLGQTLIQSIPIAFNGTTASISLDKMGRINWAELAKSVNNNIPFTVTQQQEILSNMYDAIYNDPNIKNCTSIIDLLQNYLPQIANLRSPYDEGGRYQTWEEANKPTNDGTANGNPSILALDKSFSWGAFMQSSNINLPKYQTDFDRAMEANNGSPILADNALRIQNPNNFPQTSPSVKNITVDKTTRNGSGGSYSPSDDKKQKDYASTYGRNAAKPTQVIIHIDNLARFDKTAIAGNSDERAIANAIETKIADAVSMLSAQILTTASSTISQGLS